MNLYFWWISSKLLIFASAESSPFMYVSTSSMNWKTGCHYHISDQVRNQTGCHFHNINDQIRNTPRQDWLRPETPGCQRSWPCHLAGLPPAQSSSVSVFTAIVLSYIVHCFCCLKCALDIKSIKLCLRQSLCLKCVLESAFAQVSAFECVLVWLSFM